MEATSGASELVQTVKSRVCSVDITWTKLNRKHVYAIHSSLFPSRFNHFTVASIKLV